MHTRNALALVLSSLVAAFAACYSGGPEGNAGSSSAPSASASVPPLEEGRARAQACTGCHGDDLGGGSAPVGTLYAPNLTPDVETGLGRWSDDQVARAIRTGEDDQGDDLCSTMPRFADLSDDATNAIVLYLRSLDPIQRETPDGVCPDDPPSDTSDDAGSDDASEDASPGDAGACAAFAPPSTPASCHACKSGQSCDPNGCFGGYWCDLRAIRCVPKPQGC